MEDKTPLNRNKLSKTNPSFSKRSIHQVKASTTKDFLKPTGFISPRLPEKSKYYSGSNSPIASPRSKFARSYNSSRSSSPTQDIRNLQQKAMELQTLGQLPEDDYQQLLGALANQRRESANQRNYSLCNKITVALNHVMNEQVGYQKKANWEMENQKVDDSNKEYKERLMEFDSQTKELESQLNQKQELDRKSLLQQFEDEIKDFDAKWNSPQKFRMYSHSSSMLTTMEHKLNFLIAQCRFDEAASFQKAVDHQIDIEQERNHQIMQNDYETAFKSLVEKQKRQLNFFDENADLARRTLQQKRTRLRYAYEQEGKAHENAKLQVQSPEACWIHSQTKRIADSSSLKSSQKEIPVIKLTRNDIKSTDVIKLNLPPLTSPIKKKGKQKEESDNSNEKND